MSHKWTFLTLALALARSIAGYFFLALARSIDEYFSIDGYFNALARSIDGYFFALAHSIAGPVLMLLYPLYASAKTIEKSKKASAKKEEEKSKTDNEQWLVYWILYSVLTLLEMLLERLLEHIPLWYDVKLILTAWLVLPPFKGATVLYDSYAHGPICRILSRFSSLPPP
ncbi:HVA22-like protein d isoform X2 [Eucalyptus grandis]|uniref:HVA22-like protein d isoform X2 n=1 Tax=Eucalyptus grandis TaxID=71139 RepID=UPI00192E922A|nr:HVA22-like protein d isoform X2 [Eucalyptus grandis]